MLKRLQVIMTMSNQTQLEGSVVLESAVRLSDVLNYRDKKFIVLLDQNEEVHIINKMHIIEVKEIGEVQ
ncbi:MAG: hypothetical protein SVR94_00920 [Pseudomonadota bacterium]|nr:hypothetical protein [Pseudomonadota bacterium]